MLDLYMSFAELVPTKETRLELARALANRLRQTSAYPDQREEYQVVRDPAWLSAIMRRNYKMVTNNKKNGDKAPKKVEKMGKGTFEPADVDKITDEVAVKLNKAKEPKGKVAKEGKATTKRIAVVVNVTTVLSPEDISGIIRSNFELILKEFTVPTEIVSCEATLVPTAPPVAPAK